MYRQILVPLDGSPAAEAALPTAGYLAKKFNAGLILVHLVEKNAPYTIHHQPHLHREKDAETYLKSIAEKLSAEHPAVQWHVHGSAVSNVAQSIAHHGIEEMGADLIVMCTHGNDGIGRAMFGSIAQQILLFGKIPVLIIRDDTPGTADFKISSLLVPLDNDIGHEKILTHAEFFARACAASLHLLSVIPTFTTIKGKWGQVSRLLPGSTAEMLDIAVEEQDARMKTFVDIIEKSNIHGDYALDRGDPADRICFFAQDHVDLIMMATHRRSGLSALWAGSIASKVFNDCTTPLFLLPAE